MCGASINHQSDGSQKCTVRTHRFIFGKANPNILVETALKSELYSKHKPYR